MTPHTWRRTYATILDDEMTLTDRTEADLMGQAKFLKDTYVSRGELHPKRRHISRRRAPLSSARPFSNGR